MFYSAEILSKRGPLGTIWLAAHMDRKLNKDTITKQDIIQAVQTIINPEAPIALRTSGQLMLGVVKVYDRKVNYLFHDCSEAMAKAKQVFRREREVDLDPESAIAEERTITLPENYDDLEMYYDPNAKYGVMLEDLGEDGENTRLALRVDRQSITLMDEFEEDEFETEFQRAAEERELALAEGDAGADLYDAVYNNEDGDDMKTNPDARAMLQGTAADDDDEEFGMGYNAGGDDDMEDVQPLPLDEDARKELEGAILGDVNVNAQKQSQEEGGQQQEKRVVLFGANPYQTPGSENDPQQAKEFVFGKTAQKSRVGPNAKRRRVERVIVFDRITALTNDQIRHQLQDTSDIVCARGADRGPPIQIPRACAAEERCLPGEVHPKLAAIYARNAQSCWVNFESQPTTPNAKDGVKKDLFGGNVENVDDDDDEFGGAGAGGFDDDDYDNNNNNDNMDTPRKGFSLDGDDNYDKADESGDKAMDWSVGSKRMLDHLSAQFDKTDSNELSLEEQVRGKTRADAAKMFYQVLVLRTHGYLDVEQDEAYGDVKMKPGLLLEERMKEQRQEQEA
jgi:cohesin complex subunit SCC1